MVVVGVVREIAVSAAPVLMVGSLQTVNNTTFTSNTNVLSANFPTPAQLSVTHQGLANVNDVVIKYQASSDDTNWFTFASTTMATTNATTEVIQGYNYLLTNWFRILIVTTNNQQVGVSYGN
jgi:hypothetical protein